VELPTGTKTLGAELEERIEKVVYACRFVTFLAIGGLLAGCIPCFLTVLAHSLLSLIGSPKIQGFISSQFVTGAWDSAGMRLCDGRLRRVLPARRWNAHPNAAQSHW
jgi:hypothetical protein